MPDHPVPRTHAHDQFAGAFEAAWRNELPEALLDRSRLELGQRWLDGCPGGQISDIGREVGGKDVAGRPDALDW